MNTNDSLPVLTRIGILQHEIAEREQAIRDLRWLARRQLLRDCPQPGDAAAFCSRRNVLHTETK